MWIRQTRNQYRKWNNQFSHQNESTAKKKNGESERNCMKRWQQQQHKKIGRNLRSKPLIFIRPKWQIYIEFQTKYKPDPAHDMHFTWIFTSTWRWSSIIKPDRLKIRWYVESMHANYQINKHTHFVVWCGNWASLFSVSIQSIPDGWLTLSRHTQTHIACAPYINLYF